MYAQVTTEIARLLKLREDVRFEGLRRFDAGDPERKIPPGHPLDYLVRRVAERLGLAAPKLQWDLVRNKATTTPRDESGFWTNLESTIALVDAFLKPYYEYNDT